MTETSNIVTLRSPARLAAALAKVHPDELPEAWDQAWGRLLRADSEFSTARCLRPKLERDGAGAPTWWRLDLRSYRRDGGNPFTVVDPADAVAPAERQWRAWPDLHAAWEEFERIDRAAVALFGRAT